MKSSEASNLLCKSYSYFFLAVACPDLHHELYIRASPRLIASMGAQSTASVCLWGWQKAFIYTCEMSRSKYATLA